MDALKLRSLSKDKRGVLGLQTVKSFLVVILSVAIIAMVVLITISSLNATSVATNGTKNIGGNLSEGVVTLFSNAGTWFSLLAVVVIILIISIVVIAVNRFGGGGAGL